MASGKQKYHNWLLNCNRMIQESEIKYNNDIIFAITLLLTNQTQKRYYSKKKFWVAPLFQNRNEHGFYKATLPYIRLESARFINYFRMSSTQLEDLLQIVALKLQKQTFMREPVSAEERLCLTLRYLASGDSMISMSYQYLLGYTTICNIISETCEILWNMLCPVVLPPSLTKEDWLRIAADFEHRCNFPHCIGALDGKHIVLQCPANAGSMYYNYKNSHSIVLMAICDANYLFTFIDIGAYGRRSDGGIFKECQFGKKFEQKKMDVPDADIFENGPTLPYCLVGDKAFPLKEYLLRPYSGRGGLTKEKNVFNYRLSRARRIIENTFGILASQWRILRKPIIAKVETVEKIVQAIVCLHNWLRKQDINVNEYVPVNMVDHFDDHNSFIPGTWRTVLENGSAYREIHRVGSYMSTQQNMEIRDKFCTYFNNEGSVPWQNSFC